MKKHGLDSKTYELAYIDYAAGMKYADIASKYNVSLNTVGTWKYKYKWKRVTPKRSTKVKYVSPELSESDKLFCYHFARTHNTTQAALMTGLGDSTITDMKKRKLSAQVVGYRLFRMPRIQAEIKRLHNVIKRDIHLEIQDLLQYCEKIIGADIGDYIDFGTTYIPLRKRGKIQRTKDGKEILEAIPHLELGDSSQLDTSVIAEIKQGRSGISIKLADKQWAWEQLIKYFDWLPDKWKRSVEEKRLELDAKKVAVIENTSGILDKSLAIDEHNAQIQILADLINKPVPNRDIETYENDPAGPEEESKDVK